MSIFVNRHHIPGLDHGCRGGFFDDRRPGDDVVAEQLASIEHGCLLSAHAVENHRTNAAFSRRRWIFIACRNPPYFRFTQSANRGYAQAHDIGGFCRRTVAVAELMRFVEKPFDLGARGLVADMGRHAPDPRNACLPHAQKKCDASEYPKPRAPHGLRLPVFYTDLLVETSRARPCARTTSARNRGAGRPSACRPPRNDPAQSE